jgi:hypothetical protein
VEGAGGPEGGDAEALPRGERQAVHPDRGLGVQAGGQGPICCRCREIVASEMTAEAIGNRYSRPSTRPMAAPESRTAAATPRLSRAMSVRYKDRAGGGPDVGARSEGRVPVRGSKAVAAEDQPPGERRTGHRQRRGDEHRGGEHRGLGEEPRQPPWYRGQRQLDHPGAVLVADGQHPGDGDDSLAEVSPAKLTFAGSCPHATDEHWATVRSLVHSACRAWTIGRGGGQTRAARLTRPSCAAGKGPAPARQPPTHSTANPAQGASG